MTQLSSLLTDDSRSPIQKLRRSQLQEIARKNDIKFDPAGPATGLRKLIEGSNIDVLKAIDFQRVQVEDENGRIQEIIEPIVKPHATSNKNIDYDAIIEANAKAAEKENENTELKKELDEVKAMLAKLLPKVEEDKEDEINYEMTDEYYKEEYNKIFGKKPHHKMKIETIKAKIDAKL